MILVDLTLNMLRRKWNTVEDLAIEGKISCNSAYWYSGRFKIVPRAWSLKYINWFMVRGAVPYYPCYWILWFPVNCTRIFYTIQQRKYIYFLMLTLKMTEVTKRVWKLTLDNGFFRHRCTELIVPTVIQRSVNRICLNQWKNWISYQESLNINFLCVYLYITVNWRWMRFNSAIWRNLVQF